MTRMIASRQLRKRLKFAINTAFQDSIQNPGLPLARGLGFLFDNGWGRVEALVSDSGKPNPHFSILNGRAVARGAQTLLSPRQRIGPAIERTNAKEAIRRAAATRGLGR